MWRVDYHHPIPLTDLPGGKVSWDPRISQQAVFYDDGTYLLLKRDGYTRVYRQEAGKAVYLGLLHELTLPEGFPPIAFPAGVDQIAVVPEDP